MYINVRFSVLSILDVRSCWKRKFVVQTADDVYEKKKSLKMHSLEHNLS